MKRMGYSVLLVHNIVGGGFGSCVNNKMVANLYSQTEGSNEG